MKKILLFSAVLTALVIFSFYSFSSAGLSPAPKLISINIFGPDSVPENTQSVYQVAGIYDNGSIVEVTADANVIVAPDKATVVNLGGVVETFKQKEPQEQFTIHAEYRNFTAKKLVTIHSRDSREK